MKEFVTAVEEVLDEQNREVKIKELVDGGMSVEEATEKVLSEEGVIPFKVDGRVLHAYPPNEGQMTFMLAALGRGQEQQQRFASIINLMLSCLRDEDADYLEGRLLTKDRSERMPVAQIEEIFEYLVGEWFARPTQSQSGSASSPPSGGPNSTPSTEVSTSETPQDASAEG